MGTKSLHDFITTFAHILEFVKAVAPPLATPLGPSKCKCSVTWPKCHSVFDRVLSCMLHTESIAALPLLDPPVFHFAFS